MNLFGSKVTYEILLNCMTYPLLHPPPAQNILTSSQTPHNHLDKISLWCALCYQDCFFLANHEWGGLAKEGEKCVFTH